MAAFWHAFTAIAGAISIVGIILLIKNWKHPYIQFRNPQFLIVQNVGNVASFTITTTYLALRPDFSCYLYYFGAMLIYSGMILPLAIRYWQYAINFHISKVRSLFRENVQMPDWGSQSWFFRNRWASSPRFLNIIFVVFFIILFMPNVPYYAVRGAYEYSEKTGGCDVYQVGIILMPLIAVFFVALFIVLGYLMWGSKDAYNVKTEMYALLVLWFLVILVWVPYSLIRTTLQRDLSPSVWLIIGLYGTFCTCCIYPLYLIYRYPLQAIVAEPSASGEFKWFLEQLEDTRFRNALHDFVKLQFCQENVLFYEVVSEWKRMDAGEKKLAQARFIHENYILESGLCQVNLPGEMRERITRGLAKGDAPPEFFDGALKEVLEMLYSNSLTPFKKHPIYRDLNSTTFKIFSSRASESKTDSEGPNADLLV